MRTDIRRWVIPAGLLVACVITGLTSWPPDVRAQQGRGISWIWANEGDPLTKAPAEPRYFRKTFDVPRFVDEASIDVAADKSFTVWVNGTEVGKGDNPKRVYLFDIKKHMVVGKNVVAVEARGSGGPSGLLARIGFVPNGTSRVGLSSDATWKASKDAADGWQKADFDDSKWAAAKVLGAFGKVGPWKGLVWDAGGDDRFSVPPGFRVELAVKDPYEKMEPKRKPFSLVNMCFDNRGRLLLSEEGGPILLCVNPDKDGVFQEVKPYCELVKNCHGMCWVDDALLLVGNGPKGTGLYRCKENADGSKIVSAELLLAFNGGMGEHGPHAILHGPDNWLYVVVGNHAHAKVDKLADNSPLRRWPNGQQGPDQNQPNTTEDVLLPRQNDANGHAANLKAPGGTIWRLDKDGKNISLVSAGYRNHFDAAFAPNGELWTFDSDMEWDEALPWYRPVRVCYAPMGSEFGWRTGSSKIPAYALDTLPAAYDVGRGSPVGMDFYDHYLFGELTANGPPKTKYRGCCFMADWSLGIIYAVFPERDGAGYKAKVERFCTGSPLNVTDCAVAPDGSLYFTMGGRGSQGGVYRITRGMWGIGMKTEKTVDSRARELASELTCQPLSAWGRARIDKRWRHDPDFKPDEIARALEKIAKNSKFALSLLQNHGYPPKADLLIPLTTHKDVDVRLEAVYLLGVNGYKEGQDALIKALKDEDKMVQRRACEALIRAGFEPPVDAIWPLLVDPDRFLSTAARLVLQRIDPKKWTDRLWNEKRNDLAFQGIVALCKINEAAPYTEQIFQRLQRATNGQALPEGEEAAREALDYLRTLQLALVHTKDRPASLKNIIKDCLAMFPAKDLRVSRELAIVLTYCRKEGLTDQPVHALLLKTLLAANGDRPQQIHYFYCLRLLHQGWSADEKSQLLTWFNSTQGWTGGASFTRFLDNILKDLNPIFTAADRLQVLHKAEQLPKAAAAMVRLAPADQALPPAELVKIYDKIAKAKPSPGGEELKNYIVRALAKTPSADNWPYLVSGLQSSDKPLLVELVEALQKVPTKPKADDPAQFRAVLVAASKFDDKDQKNRWKMVQLLRHWGAKSFGADDGDAKPELQALARWFGQAFPKEPPLPGSLTGKPAESKWKYDELLAFLEKDPEGKRGDVARGRVVFEKAQCLKCHKFGKEGEGIGPDLSTVAKRFKRDYILESIIDPSKVISDQYRSSTIVTKKGVTITGLAAPQGDMVTVLQSDGTKVTLQKDEIEQQIASLISVMPEKLLDPLNKQEIADLFAFLESEPK
jgi:putative heme-binding domain-containing protein